MENCLMMPMDELSILERIETSKVTGFYIQGGDLEEYRIPDNKAFYIPDLWISCGPMIRLSAVACDVAFKVEFFRMAVYIDEQFSGIENDPRFKPKRLQILEFPDDLPLHLFFGKGITSITPHTRTEIEGSIEYRIDDKLEFRNNAGDRLLLIASDERPLMMKVFVD